MRTALALVPLACAVQAQSPPKDKPPSNLPAGLTISDPSFPFPVEERAKIRDLQYEGDQLEIENNKLLLQVEKNKARELELWDKIRSLAFDFANQKKIDLGQYDLDPKDVRFVKKKKPSAAQ